MTRGKTNPEPDLDPPRDGTTDWITTWLEYQKPQESSPIYKIWAGISTIAAALERKCYIIREDRIYPNLYIIFVGPSGAARKGTAMKSSSKMLRALDGVNMAPDETTKEALIQTLARKKKDIVLPDGKTGTHCSMTIHAEELVTFLGHNDPGFMMNLTKMYDCQEVFERDTKWSGKDSIKGVWLNLLGAVTPKLLASYLTNFHVGGGFTSRLIMVYSDARGRKLVAWPDILSEEGEKAYHYLLKELSRINLLQGEFIKSDEFRAAYARWYEAGDSTHVPFNDSNLEPYAHRRATHALKLSMVFCASRTDSMILELDDFTRSLALLKLTETQMSLIYEGIGRLGFSEFFPRILNVIAVNTVKNGGVTKSELRSVFGKDLQSLELDTVLNNLNQAGKIAQVKIKKDGKFIYKFVAKKEKEKKE